MSRNTNNRAELHEVEVNLFGFLTGKWKANESQQKAAWEMYVEVVTRIAVQPLEEDEGLLREALNSLYKLFQETRRILREYGPKVATPYDDNSLTFADLAVSTLNQCLRPFLAKWHPELLDYEATREPDVSARKHERAWDEHDKLRSELQSLQETMLHYADLLAEAAGVQPVHLPHQ